jgi:transcriptional regulator with XRE-family HTH domain
MDQHAGHLLREWRQRRRLSQLDLAIAANVSSRHLSFVETGRSRPTSEMILHLAEHLDVPLRDRNALLLAGGYAPAYAERGLAEPELSAVRQALKRVLAGHEPYPAVVVNRWWELVDANAAIALAGLHEELAAGTPMDITVSELAIESFYPADETTAAALT